MCVCVCVCVCARARLRLLLSCIFSLYVLDINPGEVRWFADTFPFCRENIFSLFWLFILLIIYFTVQRLFSLRYFQLFLFLLFALLVLVIFKWFPANWIFQAQPKLISFSLDYVPCFLVSVYM